MSRESRRAARRAAKKRKNKALIILLCCFFGIILIGFGTVFFTGYHILDLLRSPEDSEHLKPNPDLVAEDNVDIPDNLKDTFDKGDDDIARNIAYGNTLSDPDVFTVILAGYDYGNHAKENYYPRADATILVSINKKTQKVTMVSLSRAVYNAIPGVGNKRLNMAYAYGGGKLLMQTIEQNYKVSVDNYIAVGFESFAKIVDIVGGVNITLTQEEYNALYSELVMAGINPHGAGTYRLNGEAALSYVRLRSIDSDRARTGRQRNFLTSILNEVKNISANQLIELINQILPEIETDLTKTQIISEAINVPKYIQWPMSQDIIPYKKHPLHNIGGTEYLLIDWNDNVYYLQKLLYPQKF